MPDPGVKSGVKPGAAIDFLRRRLKLKPEAFNVLAREADAAARDRAAGMGDALFQDILAAVLEALEAGTALSDFTRDFDQLTKAHGWSGDNEAGWRSALTFRTMTAQAMAAGRWAEIQRMKKRRPFIRYVTAGDHRVRHEHAAWHGLILPVEDPFWQTHFPPNGFNCRCHVQSVAARDLARYGWAVSESPPVETVIKFVRVKGVLKPVETPKGIDPGFAFNPGEIGLKLPD